MATIKNEKNQNPIINFTFCQEGGVFNVVLSFLFLNETMNFLSLYSEMLKIKNIFIRNIDIKNNRCITILKKRYNKIYVDNLFLSYGFKNCDFLKLFVNINSIHFTNKVLRINDIFEHCNNKNIKNITFNGDILFSDNHSNIVNKQKNVNYDILNNFMRDSQIQNVRIIKNGILNNYTNLIMDGLIKATFSCNCLIDDIPNMDNITFLKISSSLLSNFTADQVFEFFKNKFKNLKELHIDGCNGENYIAIVDKIKWLLTKTIYNIKVVAFNGNVIISHINYSKMFTFEDVGSLMSEITLKPFLKYLIISIDDNMKYISSQMASMLSHFLISRDIRVIYKTKNGNTMIKKTFVDIGRLNHDGADL